MTALRAAGGSFVAPRHDAGTFDVALLALALSTFSRLLVASLGVPSAVNFLHFPVVGGLFLFSLWRLERVAAPIHIGCTALFLIYIVSAWVNGAGAVNAIIGFMLLSEPFLLFAVLVNARPNESSIRRLGWGLLALAVVQIPIALAQWPQAIAARNADLVQGTFTGMVAGHHILGGVAMVGALHLLRWPRTCPGWIRWPLAALLFGVVVISDTKQVMLAFLVGYAVVRASSLRSVAQASRWAVRIAVLILGVYVAQRLAGTHTYFHQIGNVISGFAGKLVVFPILVDHFDSIANWVFGVGPGHGVSRMGGWLLEKYWHVLEPLGATRTEIAAEAWQASGQLGHRSSFFIPLFSWAAIFGDVGVAGVAVYGALMWLTLRRFCVDDTGRIMVVSIFCLGLLFEWLEEPNFMLYALAVIAQSWLASSLTSDTETSPPFMKDSLRIAWLLPMGGLHWHPALVELGRRCPGLKVFTARESFARELEPNVDVEVVGRARVVGADPIAPGYRARLTLVSPRILVQLFRFRPALVFTNSFGIWTTVAILLKPVARWPVIIAYEGSAPGVDFRRSRLRIMFRRMLVRGADACITNTQAGRRYLTDVLGARPELVSARPYLVPTQEFFELDSNGAARRLGAMQRPRFLYVGKLTARKGVRQLLEACAYLDRLGTPRYSLVIVGDGPLRQELESLATGLGLGGRVHWVGHVPYSAVGEYLDAADVLVLPTWEDTWGMTVPEALLAGKPVLCSVRAGSSELVEDGRNGYLFDPLDPTMLAERMRRFVEHPERSEEMGRRGRQVIAEHTPKAAGDFLVTVAQKVLQRSALQ
jgi:glycosyltransferase involved in cell wall biosynthesis